MINERSLVLLAGAASSSRWATELDYRTTWRWDTSSSTCWKSSSPSSSSFIPIWSRWSSSTRTPSPSRWVFYFIFFEIITNYRGSIFSTVVSYEDTTVFSKFGHSILRVLPVTFKVVEFRHQFFGPDCGQLWGYYCIFKIRSLDFYEYPANIEISACRIEKNSQVPEIPRWKRYYALNLGCKVHRRWLIDPVRGGGLKRKERKKAREAEALGGGEELRSYESQCEV